MQVSESSSWQDEPGWSQARDGLALCFRSQVALCIFMGVAMLGGIMGAMFAGFSDGMLDFTVVFTVVINAGWLMVLGVFATGLGRLRAVPTRTRAGGLATTAFACAIASIALTVAAVALKIPRMDSLVALQEVTALDLSLSIAITLAGGVCAISYLLAVQRAAVAIEDYRVAGIARLTVTLVIVITACMGLMTLVSPMVQEDPLGGSATIVVLLGLIGVGIGIWALVNTMRATYHLRNAIARQLDVTSAF